MSTQIKFKTILAIVCITILAILAIVYQVNGKVLALALAAIAGLGGYEIGIHRKK